MGFGISTASTRFKMPVCVSSYSIVSTHFHRPSSSMKLHVEIHAFEEGIARMILSGMTPIKSLMRRLLLAMKVTLNSYSGLCRAAGSPWLARRLPSYYK